METQGFDISQEGHRNPRLITVGMSNHHPALVCLCLQNWAKERIELRVHQHDVFIVVEGLQNHARRSLDRSRYFEDYIDSWTSREHRGIIGQCRNAAVDRRFRLPCCRHPAPFLKASLAESPF